MRVWIIPSSLFVSGRLMQALWLARDLEAAEKKRAAHVQALAELPVKIAALDGEIAEFKARLQKFKEIT